MTVHPEYPTRRELLAWFHIWDKHKTERTTATSMEEDAMEAFLPAVYDDDIAAMVDLIFTVAEEFKCKYYDL